MWDKYGSSSSIIVLDYDVIRKKFKVIKRVELPKSEYSYDTAIQTIVEINEIYNPSWIYCDSGAGEYQIERLHIIGDERPETGLKHKVKRCSFASSIDVVDPVTHEVVKEPFKPFMINQLVLAFERDRIIMSPFDDVLHKQLVNYEVEKINANGKPVYTSKDEHFIDALGLANLAFVMEFKELTATIKDLEVSSKISFINKTLGAESINRMFDSIQTSYSNNTIKPDTSGDLRGDRPSWFKVSQNYRSGSTTRRGSWGTRGGRSMGRSSW